MKSILKTLAIFSMLFLSACSEKDVDKVGDAQNCIDTATNANVTKCLDKIKGINTPAAYAIRCSAKFIEEGFDEPSRFVTAFQQLDNSSGSGSSTLGFMGVLAFSSNSDWTTNETNANLAMEYCEKSESPGMITLAGAAKIATSMAKIASSVLDGNLSQADMEAALTSCTGDTTCQTAIGSATIAIYNSSCSGDTKTNKDFCADIEGAITNAGVSADDPAAVGAALAAILAHP